MIVVIMGEFQLPCIPKEFIALISTIEGQMRIDPKILDMYEFDMENL